MYRIIGCAKLNSNKWKIRGQWTCLREYETFLENLLSLFMQRFRSSVLSKNIGVKHLTHGFLLSLVLLSYCFPHVTTGVIPCKDSSSSSTQGWEFAHFISERIFCFLSKNERTSDSLKKMGNSLIHSFLVSKMSNSLTWLISSERPERIAHGRSVLMFEMSDSLTSFILFERYEQFIHIAHKKRGNERKLGIRSFFELKKNL